MDYSFLAYDALAVIVVVICMYNGKKNGFAKTFVQTFGFAVAIVAALVISRIGASLIYSTFVEPSLISELESSIENAIDTSSVVEGLKKAIDGLPTISKLLFDFEGVEEELGDITGLDTLAIAQKVEDTVIEPIIVPLMEIILFIVSLIILLLVVGLLAKGTKEVNDVPIVGGINGFFGAVAGILSGVVVVCIISSLVCLYIRLKGPNQWVSEEMVSKTYLFHYFYDFINGDILPF